jgi:hypothetical protein
VVWQTNEGARMPEVEVSTFYTVIIKKEELWQIFEELFYHIKMRSDKDFVLRCCNKEARVEDEEARK